MDNTKVIKEEKTVAFRERKRILFFGLPFTFTVYTASNVVVTVDTGFFNREENDAKEIKEYLLEESEQARLKRRTLNMQNIGAESVEAEEL